MQSSDFERSSIQKKFTQYLAIETLGIHRSHFGFPNLFVPFVTTTKARLHSMVRLLEHKTIGAGSKAILFATFPADRLAGNPPLAANFLAQEWQRAGHPPFSFLTS